jgi:PLP dependent protein
LPRLVPVLVKACKHGLNPPIMSTPLPTTAAHGLTQVHSRIDAAIQAAGRPAGSVGLVAVSKTHDAETILPLLAAGQRCFGENRVQEAKAKWPDLRRQFPDLSLHLIGPLQTNKVAEAVALFDVIQTVDRDKLAAALATEMKKQNRHLPCLVQVNIGREPQKAGIDPADAASFVTRAREVHGLNIVGLMCIPPADEDPVPYFSALAALQKQLHLPQLSMGMSGDYASAIAHGATLVRVGSAIFGARPVIQSSG